MLNAMLVAVLLAGLWTLQALPTRELDRRCNALLAVLRAGLGAGKTTALGIALDAAQKAALAARFRARSRLLFGPKQGTGR